MLVALDPETVKLLNAPRHVVRRRSVFVLLAADAALGPQLAPIPRDPCLHHWNAHVDVCVVAFLIANHDSLRVDPFETLVPHVPHAGERGQPRNPAAGLILMSRS